MINPIGIIITVLFYELVKKFKNLSLIKILTPVLITGILIIIFLKLFNIDYNTYKESASYLTFLLIPATICLGYPLYKNLDILTKNKRIIYISFLIGIITTFITTYYIARLCNSDFNIIASLFPKSVTAPIALEISKTLLGTPELSACIVVLTGVFGGIFGHKILKIINVKNDIAIGLAIGSASHMIGTGKCIEKGSKKQVAASTLALVAVGILTVILAPLALKILGKF